MSNKNQNKAVSHKDSQAEHFNLWPFAFILITGIIIRLVLVPYTSSSFDVMNWLKLSSDLPKSGLGYIYVLHAFRYPPLWAYILYIIGLANPLSVDLNFLFLIKTA